MDVAEFKAFIEEIKKTFTENQDSIELGGSVKTGKIKVYGNLSRPEEMAEKIKNGLILRNEFNPQMNGGEQ